MLCIRKSSPGWGINQALNLRFLKELDSERLPAQICSSGGVRRCPCRSLRSPRPPRHMLRLCWMPVGCPRRLALRALPVGQSGSPSRNLCLQFCKVTSLTVKQLGVLWSAFSESCRLSDGMRLCDEDPTSGVMGAHQTILEGQLIHWVSFNSVQPGGSQLNLLTVWKLQQEQRLNSLSLRAVRDT